MDNQDLAKTIIDDSFFLSSLEGSSYHEIFTEILPSMKVDVSLLENFYSYEFDLNDEDIRKLIIYLDLLDSKRLNEFIYHLLSLNYNFIDFSDRIMKVVEEEKDKIKNKNQYEVIENGYINILKFFMKKGRIKFKIYMNEFFNLAVQHGHLDIIKYLMSLESIYWTLDIEYRNYLRISIEKGNLEIFKYLISLEDKYGNVDIHDYNEKLFSIAVYNNRLDFVEYLISLESTYGQFDIHVVDERFIHIAIRKGYLDIIKYLVSLEKTHGPIDIHINDESMFKIAIHYGHLEIFKYLLSLEKTHGSIDILFDRTPFFRIANRHGHTHIIEFLNEWNI